MIGDGETRLATLRRDFDQAFARAHPQQADDLARLVGLRVGAGRYVVRLDELGGLHERPPVTPLPGGAPALMGLASHQGDILAVYDLATLLGLPDDRARARWIVMARGEPSVALAFTELEGHHRVSQAAIIPASNGSDPSVLEFLAVEEMVLGVLSLEAVIASITSPTGQPGA